MLRFKMTLDMIKPLINIVKLIVDRILPVRL